MSGGLILIPYYAGLTLLCSKHGVDATDGWCRSDVPLGDRLRTTSGGSSGLGLCFLLLLLVYLLRVTVEEHVDHDVPAIGGAGDGAAEAEDLAGKEPPDETDRMTRLVVRRDRNVDVFERRVRVRERDDGDVDVGRLADRLVVDARVRHDDQAGLLERARDVVREGARGEAACDRLGARVGGVFEDGAMPVRSCRDHANVVGVLDGGNNPCSKDELLPCLSDVEDVDTCAENKVHRERVSERPGTKQTHRPAASSKRRVPSACRSSSCRYGIVQRGEAGYLPLSHSK